MNEHEKAIKDALTKMREDLANLRDHYAEEITLHLKALGIEFHDDFQVYDEIEKAAKINAESFFESVGYHMGSLCEDIVWCGQ